MDVTFETIPYSDEGEVAQFEAAEKRIANIMQSYAVTAFSLRISSLKWEGKSAKGYARICATRHLGTKNGEVITTCILLEKPLRSKEVKRDN